MRLFKIKTIEELEKFNDAKELVYLDKNYPYNVHKLDNKYSNLIISFNREKRLWKINSSTVFYSNELFDNKIEA